MNSNVGRLENWKRVQITKKEFSIIGNIFSDIHNRWDDGAIIHTSGILNRSILVEGDTVHTRNNTYLLGVEHEQ